MSRYISTDPNAGREPVKYLSMDPMDGIGTAQTSAPETLLDRALHVGRMGQALPGAVASVYGDYAQGALKGLGRIAAPVVQAVGLGNDYTDAALTPENAVESVGGTGAQLGAGALASSATGVLGAGAGLVSKAARALTTPAGAGVAAGVGTKVAGGSNSDAVQNAVLAATLGKVTGGAKPIRPGHGVVKPLPHIKPPKATPEQIKAAVEAGPRGNAAKRAMREGNGAREAAKKVARDERYKTMRAEKSDAALFDAKTGEPVKLTPDQAKAAVDDLPWNKSKATKSPAQVRFEEVKAKRSITVQPALKDRIGKAISPDAAWKDLQKHGAGDGKRIPRDDARAMVDEVWGAKEGPGYTSIEQWMADRAEKWNAMRHKSGKKGN